MMATLEGARTQSTSGRTTEDPLGEIRVIIEGCTMAGSSKKARKTYLQMMQSMQLTRCSPKLI